MRYSPPIIRDLPVTMRGKLRHYPVEMLLCGESFFAPFHGRKAPSVTGAIYVAIKRLRTRFPPTKRLFIVRRARELGIEGVRCWRIR